MAKPFSNITQKANQYSSLEIKLVEVNLEHKHPNAVHLKSDLKVLANSTNIESRNRNLSGSDKYSLTRPCNKKCNQHSKQKFSNYLTKTAKSEMLSFNSENKFYDSQRSQSRNDIKMIHKSNSKGSNLIQSFKTKIDKSSNRLSKGYGKELVLSGNKKTKRGLHSKQLPALPIEFKSTLSSLNMKIGRANEVLMVMNSKPSLKGIKKPQLLKKTKCNSKEYQKIEKTHHQRTKTFKIYQTTNAVPTSSYRRNLSGEMRFNPI